jgi:hypothetical protein
MRVDFSSAVDGSYWKTEGHQLLVAASHLLKKIYAKPRRFTPTHPHLKAAASMSSPTTATAHGNSVRSQRPSPHVFLAEDFVLSIPR